MIVPPAQSGPPLPEAKVVKDDMHIPAERAGRGEKAMLIAVAVMFVILFLSAVVLPHLPIVAEGGL